MKTVTKLFFPALFLFLLSSCGHKKKDKKEKFFPVLSIIQSQVKHVDTSLYTIRKIIFHDSLKNDTLYIPREEFRQEAQDFLTIPDISATEYSGRFTETKDFYPELNRASFLYLPVNPEKEEIQRQEVLLRPGNHVVEDRITNIIINSLVNTRDSSVQKKMMWTIDKSFQVTTIGQLKNEEEKVSTFKIVWNEEEQE